jgi:6-phosphogluconolactonase
VGEFAVSGAEVRVAPDELGLARLAAEEVVLRSRAAARDRGWFTWVLAGGTTPRRLYAVLADPRQPWRGRMPWAATHVFFGDERHVPPDAPESNYRMAQETLLRHVPIPDRQVHRISAEGVDAETVAADYEAELRGYFGLAAGALPRFDLVLLGVGADGHTASLFPGSPALLERCRLVAAPWVEHLRARRVTLTLPVLEAAAAVVFLVAGAEKAARVAEALDPTGASPAARVRPTSGALLWLLDAAAAACLPAARLR